MTCTYLGTDYEPGGPDGEGDESGGEQEEAGGEAPADSSEAPEDEEGNPEPCPPGTREGYVNGDRVCAPDSGSEAPPPTDPTETDPTGLGPKVDSLKSSIEATRAAVEATGNAVNRQTALLESGLNKVVGAINAQGPNVGGDGGGGEGGGDPAGDCDPTAADYFQCAGLVEEIGDTVQGDLIADADAAAESSMQASSDAVIAAIESAAEGSPVDSPSVGSSLSSILPSSSACQPLIINFPGHPMTLPCQRFDFFKQVFGWFLYLSTAIYIFHIGTRPVGD